VAAVVPTLDEGETIAKLVAALRREVDEVWVVDGGSRDDTPERARAFGAEVLLAPAPSRGDQLDRGARAAEADALVFVHADTGVPAGFGAAIRTALRDPAVVGGNFRVRYAPSCPSARLFGVAGDLRQRWLGLHYGDSCIFVRRETYLATGGFADHPLFEDHALARALRRLGRTVMLGSPAVTSSSRRFRGRAVRTLALWTGLQLAYSLGVSPTRLAHIYRGSQ
jgi:rSAM/selenodomain-associated transferase 2